MFRTVLVHVDSLGDSAKRTALAIDLARQFDATLIGLTAGLPRLPIEVYDASLGTVALGPDYTEFDRKHIEAEFGKAEAAFLKATDGSGLETSWRAVFGAPSAAIIAAAVAADIVVVGPGDRSLLGTLASASAGDIVLRTGRPVLVAPGEQDRIVARSILVAWKDTAEAQRAVADAVPFMKRAAAVTVVAVQEGSDRPPELDDAIAFLLRHGIAAKADVIQPKGLTVEEAIIDRARRSQADLIVAGAYGHSRFREWAFGGVTRALLTAAPVPCLFSH
jgi:nucleotide-binding universal stress UspA family protein